MVYRCMLNIGGDMLEKILQVKGVGLFHDVNGESHKLQKASIIYADNGRGKSTLVSLFRSCSTNNPELLLKRRTIDGSYDPEVKLLFSDGQQPKFKNRRWDAKRPELLVFDADFVEQNVYAGGQVTPNQRKNLLQFVLGENAVVAKQEYDKADLNVKTAAGVVSETTNKLSEIHKGLTLEKFEDLPKVSDADDKIATLNKNIIEAQNMGSIKSKPLPPKLADPDLNIEPFFKILDTSLANIDADAERQVKEHLDTHNKPQLEKWISDGHAYGEEEKCLFCNQPLKEVELIKAYRSYFNQDYKKLKSDVARLTGLITEICSNEIIYELKSRFEAARACIHDWQKDIEIKIAMPIFDENAARNALVNIQSLLEKLKQSKEAKLLDEVGSEDDKNKIVKEWQTILDVVVAYNKSILNAAELITAYKYNLTKLDIDDLQQEIRELKWAKIRYRPDVIELLVQLKKEVAQEKKVRAERKMKKDELDEIVKATLDRYKDSINNLLEVFGAQFCIPNINFNYYSGIRSDYALQMRNKDIDLSGGIPDFKTSLSEGDKRTLAFAFFIASVGSNPDLANKIIIIDDPMCSLDLNRKQQTCTVLKKLHDNCKQMIVLAHDIYFLKDFLGVFDKQQSENITCLKLKAVENDYSDFDTINIEQACESTYFKRHRTLREYMKTNIEPSLEIATSIRPMLEGYLHNRFPNLMGDKPSFGKMIRKIIRSKDSCPLSNARNIADELDEINLYTRQFHHGNQTEVVDSELRVFVKRALAVVYE